MVKPRHMARVVSRHQGDIPLQKRASAGYTTASDGVGVAVLPGDVADSGQRWQPPYTYGTSEGHRCVLVCKGNGGDTHGGCL